MKIWNVVNKMKPDTLTATFMEVKLPYCILIASFGVIFGILGCVASGVMYKKMLDFDSEQLTQEQNQIIFNLLQNWRE